MAACAPRLQPPGLQSATPAMTHDALVMDDGVALPLRAWRPLDRDSDGRPSAVILALHGFNDYSAAFAMPAAYWARHGIVTYAFDQRGFGLAPHRGLWAGEARMMRDLRIAAGLVAARHPGVPLYLLGESMGGALVAAAAVAPPPLPVDGVILVAPAVWGRETQGPLQSALLWLAAHSVPWMTVTGEGLDILPSDNFAMLRALGRDPLVIKETRLDTVYGLVGLMDAGWAAAPELRAPALLLYGAREEVIPEDAALAWLRRLPPDAAEGPGHGPRAALYPNGYHMLLRDLDAGVVWNDIARWIAARAEPLPSGAEALAAAIIASDADDFTAARNGGTPPAAVTAAPEGTAAVEGAAAAVLE